MVTQNVTMNEVDRNSDYSEVDGNPFQLDRLIRNEKNGLLFGKRKTQVVEQRCTADFDVDELDQLLRVYSID